MFEDEERDEDYLYEGFGEGYEDELLNTADISVESRESLLDISFLNHKDLTEDQLEDIMLGEE